MKADAQTLTKALDWVNHRLKATPPTDKVKAVDEASMKFNLGPLDQEWLFNQLRASKEDS